MTPPFSKQDSVPMPETLGALRTVWRLRLPLATLLRDSLYYPASGGDGSPVACLNGFVHSFVYADYGLRPQQVRKALRSSRLGFKGYRVKGIRPVWKHEVFNRPDPDPPPGRRFLRPGDLRILPIGLWALLERRPGIPPQHGPERFSFLFLRAEGVSTYRRLYNAHGMAPSVLALICPGHAFGHNWTNFCDPFGPLAHVARQNPEGVPRHILFDGSYERQLTHCCWYSHTHLLGFLKAGRKTLGLWRCDTPRACTFKQPLHTQEENPYDNRLPTHKIDDGAFFH